MTKTRVSAPKPKSEFLSDNINQLRPIKVSVILVCKNVADTIGIQLDALAAQDCDDPWELIISDHGSMDETLSVASRYIGKINNLRVIDSPAGQGKACALNKAAKAARGEYLLYCGAEDEVAPGWLAAMSSALSQNDFVTCRANPDKFSPRWVIECLGHLNRREGARRHTSSGLFPQANRHSIGVKRWIHDAVGGFDESLTEHQKKDYCWRIQRLGIELHCVSGATINVRYGGSMAKLYRMAFGCGEYDSKMCRKYTEAEIAKPSFREGMLALLSLPAYALKVRNKSDFAHIAWQTGYRLGQLKAGIKANITAF